MKCQETGTACSTRYVYHKCRCASCKEWKRQMSQRDREKYPERTKAAARKWYLENYEVSRERNSQWRQKNPERYKELGDSWRRTNPGKVAENVARSRARKLNQTPNLSPEEKARIKEIYEDCQRISKETGIPHDVDHIKPLAKGGLHHPDNLQILSASENRSKGAKYDQESSE